MKLLLFRIAIASVCLVLLLAAAHAQVPQLINYQGRIVVGSTNFTGTGNFKFALVNAPGTTAYWTNDGTHLDGTEPTTAVSLTVNNGLFSVLLGDAALTHMTAVPATVFNNSDVRLRIWFNDGTHGSEQLGPDQRIAAVGYAVIAGNVSNGAITSTKIANGAVGAAQLANGSVTSTKIDATTVQKRVTGAAPAGQFIQSINADGTVVASGLTAAGSSTQLQFNNSGTFGGLANVKYDTTHSALTLFGDIPADLGSTPETGANGGKLSIFGTEGDKPSLAVIGDHRNGASIQMRSHFDAGSGARYATVITPNGGIITNAFIDVAASGTLGDGGVFRLNSDIPIAASIYTPYNPESGGRLLQFVGIPTAGPGTEPLIWDNTSQGKFYFNNPYGSATSYTDPQIVIQDTSAGTTDTSHRAYGIRALDGEFRVGSWDDAGHGFGTPYFAMTPTEFTLFDPLVIKTSSLVGRIYFGDKTNNVGIGTDGSFIFYHGNLSTIQSDADSTLDLGTSGARFRNLFLSGTADARGLVIRGNSGNFSVTDGSIVDTTRSTLYIGYNAGAGTSVNLAGGKATVSASTGKLVTSGGVQPPHLADASAANDTIYYSTTANALVYKDAGGTVHRLY